MAAMRAGAFGLLSGAGDAAPRVWGPTELKILSATLRLLGRRGVKRLAMQEVSEAAGISRGTLYRYFPSKEQLLAGVAEFDEQRFTVGLAHALEGADDRVERVKTLVSFAFDYIRTHPARSLFGSEPDFVLGYLLVHLPKLEDALLEQLGDAFDAMPAVSAGKASRRQVADVIVRLFTSSFLIPEPDDRALVQSINAILLQVS